MKAAAVSIFLAALCCTGSAKILDLSYQVHQNGSVYDYSFTLSVDSSYTLKSGDNWTSISFGDHKDAASQFDDFSLTSGSPLPFKHISWTSGYHNGPTWDFREDQNLVVWTPKSQSDTLTWTGTSASCLTQGQLLYSEMYSSNNSPLDSFSIATQAVPEPASFLCIAVGLVGLVAKRRRNS